MPCTFSTLAIPLRRRPVTFAGRLLFGLACTLTAARVPAGGIEDKVPPFDNSSRGGLLKHAGTYPAFAVAWQCMDAVKDANAVFPHPIIPGRALLATASGLQITEDQGQNWQSLPEGGGQRLGPVNEVTFNPRQPDTFYVASRTRGVWVTTDNGGTFKQIGAQSTGLAGDNALAVEIYANDQVGRTLLVSHGDAAPGLSRSLDAGKTWSVLFPEYHVYRIFSAGAAGQDLFITAATVAEPDSPRLFIAPSLTEPWQEMGRDLICTGITAPRLRGGWVLVATANRGILRITRNGGVVRNIAPAGITEWAGIGATWGATADTQVIYAFEPTKLGMVILDPAGGATSETKEMKPNAAPAYSTASNGLLTCAVVREGAHIRANANGSVFYACINSLLYRGERAGGSTPVRSVTLSTPVSRFNAAAAAEAIGQINNHLRNFNATSDIRVSVADLRKTMAGQDASLANRRETMTAVIDHAAGKPPRQVTVDLSRLGLSARTPMLPAGGGAYTATFAVDPQRAQRNGEDWRQFWPIGLTITAVAESGELSSGIGAMTVVETSSGYPFVSRAGGGPRTAEVGKIQFLDYESPITRKGRKIPGFRVTQSGPWRVQYFRDWGEETLDLSSFEVISFRIRTRKESTEDISLQLRDSPVFGRATMTKPLPLIKGGFVPEGKFTGNFQHIIVPISRLIANAENFQPAIVRTILVSGETSAPAEYYIDNIIFHASAEAAADDEEE